MFVDEILRRVNRRRFAIAAASTALALLPSTPVRAQDSLSERAVLEEYCVTCHNDTARIGDMSLDGFDPAHPESNAELAENIIRKLRAGMMPPTGLPRPEPAQATALVEALEHRIDAAADATPAPGTRPSQRINRAEYQRLIEDLLGLSVDPAEWLPEDPVSASFDNIADVQTVTPTLMVAYLTAASDIARRALGQEDAPVLAKTYTNPPAVSQHEWERVEGAPFGTRGGISVVHNFPADGEYTFSMTFMSGWGERFHDVDVSVNGERLALLQYGGDIDFQGRKDFPFETESVFVRAGERRLSAAFIRQLDGPYEDLLRPNDWSLTGTETSYGTTSPPHLMSLTVTGPFHPSGVSASEPRRRVFSCRPTSPGEERPCATDIVRRLATKAYGRAVTDAEIDDLMGFYEGGAAEAGFERGVRSALEAILVSPHFLFRIEREPSSIQAGEIYRLDDLELASRLSFFLWGTHPDEELLAQARAGELSTPDVLRADYTFLNERLARHYGIEGITGETFRKVRYPDARRRGILGHGSMLVQTSLGNRTSPVLRGKWVMEVLMGTPPPPPPPNVPDLEATEGSASGAVLTTRQRLELHRQNPSCASCHNLIDPIGLALDNFDVTGKWRIRENGTTLDTRTSFYDGTEITSASELSEALLARPETLVRQFVSSLMAYALGRRVEHHDQPTVRAVSAGARAEDYRLSSFVLGIVASDGFQMKQAAGDAPSQPTEAGAPVAARP